MKRTGKVALMGVVALGLIPLLGFGSAGLARGPGGEVEKVEAMFSLVKKVYEACGKREGAVVLAVIHIQELGKKGKVDAPAALAAIYESVKDDRQLASFVGFVLANVQKDSGDHPAALETLNSIVDLNVNAERE
ncbi:MAG: hypothetical protein HY722_08125 [Planctomycetes bacterium]|nr:hypothetical protein [Planctomycetota bacterium]